MDEYIERMKAINEAMDYDGNGNAQDASQDIASRLYCIPAADVCYVIRCEYCEFWDSNHISREGLARCLTGESGVRYRNKLDFCSRGKRKDGIQDE